jgi:hypothetical protein
MTDDRFAAHERYTKRYTETAEGIGMPFYGMAKQALQATIDWQTFMLNLVRETANLVEVHKAILDAVGRESSAFVDLAPQQFANSMTVFTNLTQQWIEDATSMQNRFAAIFRPPAETGVPHRPRNALADIPEVSGIDSKDALNAAAEPIIVDPYSAVHVVAADVGQQESAPAVPIIAADIDQQESTPAVPIIAADIDQQESTPAMPIIAADVDEQESTPAVYVVGQDVDQQDSVPAVSVVAAEVDEESIPVVEAEAPVVGLDAGTAVPLTGSKRRNRGMRKPKQPLVAGQHPQVHRKNS